MKTKTTKTDSKSSMKGVILAGIKSGHAVGGKKQLKKTYTFNGSKQKDADSALKVLGALNSLTHLITAIEGYARKVVFDNIVPQWIHDVLAGEKEIGAFEVSAGDAKALIVPMKKYAVLDDERASTIHDLNHKYHLGIEIKEIPHFEINPHLLAAVPEEKMDAVIDALKQALLKSAALPDKAKRDIRSGKLSVIEESTEYRYDEDILTHLTTLSKGNDKVANAIVDAVKPVFAIRSFEMNNKELQLSEALDLIKENMHVLPDLEK